MDHPHPEVLEYYTSFAEENRLSVGVGRLELERTKELILRHAPPAPASVADVGGGAGVYSFWLAGLQYDVDLIDPTPRLVEAARLRNQDATMPLRSLQAGDARRLPLADGSADVVLLMGPLYHLLERQHRLASIREGLRVLRAGGVIFAAAISRYAAVLDAVAFHPGLPSDLADMRTRATADGRYRNTSGNPRYFVTAYFHRPEDLGAEMTDAGARRVDVFGVEGPGWLIHDFDGRWDDQAARAELLAAARLVEREPSLRGVSAHLLAVARKS
jgi:SAM-dependent methyltransferase